MTIIELCKLALEQDRLIVAKRPNYDPQDSIRITPIRAYSLRGVDDCDTCLTVGELVADDWTEIE